MDRTEQILIIVGLAIIVTMAITAIVLFTNQGSETSIETNPIDATDDVGYDYSQYDVLKKIVEKLDVNGGTITDIRGAELVFSASRNVVLKDDLLLITSADEKDVYIYHIHDIRSIRVN